MSNTLKAIVLCLMCTCCKNTTDEYLSYQSCIQGTERSETYTYMWYTGRMYIPMTGVRTKCDYETIVYKNPDYIER